VEEVTMTVAAPAALVAMKLHSIQDRKQERPAKAASDAEDLYRLIREHNGNGPGGFVAFGFTSEVSALMAVSDVVVSTAGQTCHEARVIGRPLIVLDGTLPTTWPRAVENAVQRQDLFLAVVSDLIKPDGVPRVP